MKKRVKVCTIEVYSEKTRLVSNISEKKVQKRRLLATKIGCYTMLKISLKTLAFMVPHYLN